MRLTDYYYLIEVLNPAFKAYKRIWNVGCLKSTATPFYDEIPSHESICGSPA